MAINPNLIDIKKVTELTSKLPILQAYFAHCESNGVLYKATMDQLATFLAPYITAIGGSGFLATTGSVLPDASAGKFTIVGAGTFTQTTGGNVVTTELLNILGSSPTTWSLVTAIPLPNVALKTDLQYKGAFNSIADAIIAVPLAQRKLGDTVGVLVAGDIIEYWFESSTANEGLILKDKSGGDRYGKNMFNKYGSFSAGQLDSVTGILAPNAGFVTSDFIHISEAGSYIGSSSAYSLRKHTRFDAKKQIIADASGNNSTTNAITLSSEVKYVKLSIDVNAVPTFQFEKGTTKTTYAEPLLIGIDGRTIRNADKDLFTQEAGDSLINRVTTTEVVSDNLGNETVALGKTKLNVTLTQGGFIRWNTGAIDTLVPSYWYSDFFQAKKGRTYLIYSALNDAAPAVALYSSANAASFIQGLIATIIQTDTRFTVLKSTTISGRYTPTAYLFKPASDVYVRTSCINEYNTSFGVFEFNKDASIISGDIDGLKSEIYKEVEELKTPAETTAALYVSSTGSILPASNSYTLNRYIVDSGKRYKIRGSLVNNPTNTGMAGGMFKTTPDMSGAGSAVFVIPNGTVAGTIFDVDFTPSEDGFLYTNKWASNLIFSVYNIAEGGSRFESIDEEIEFLNEKVNGVNPFLEVGAGKQFTTIKSALAYIKANPSDSVIDLKIYGKGSAYELTAEYTEAELLTPMDAANNPLWLGPYIPRKVRLIGVNNPTISMIWTGADHSNNLSLFNTFGDFYTRGINYIGRNLRYLFHQDCLPKIYGETSYYDSGNYTLEKQGAGYSYSHSILGIGITDGGIINIDTMRSINNNNNSKSNSHIYAHMDGKNEKCVIKINNSSFSGGQSTTRFQKLADTNVMSELIIDNSILDQPLFLDTGTKIDHNVIYKGGGNTNARLNIDAAYSYESPMQYFEIDSARLKNVSASTIPAKTLVKNSGFGVTPMANGDNIILFVGIVSKAIATTDFGLVKITGDIAISQTNLVSANVGDKITITNGVFTVTTGTEYVGVIKRTGYLTLI